MKQTVLEWKGSGSKLCYTKVVGCSAGLATFDDKLHMVCSSVNMSCVTAADAPMGKHTEIHRLQCYAEQFSAAFP